ncbi:MAG: nucleoside-triphosphatase [Bacteroidales bacterium]|jgi:nucleoside-triphosphatase THEP1|nr:nucleoside-triphosphatase [Bacteroidales bacterium]
MKERLSEKWIKASITGTIWAASEIVLGSFLHNLRVPFSGNILTAIGIIILISISYIWTDKGLIWRSGIICALMKTMSPSAVIFGPMIAILAEAFLIESSVRLLGRTYAGYLTGAMLAMSWNLFQKIANYIIFYGAGIIDVYNNLIGMAGKELGIGTDIGWFPVIILLVVFALFGIVSGIIGISVGKKMKKQPSAGVSLPEGNGSRSMRPPATTDFRHSLVWLLADFVLMIACLSLITFSSWMIWGPVVTSVIILWSLKYKRALRQLSRPKFWLFFVFITLITAFALSQAQKGEVTWQQGLLTGIQMNFRAAVIIVGFSVLGTELYNPRIRDFFMKTTFKDLPLALELSAESLPSFIASVPDFKSLVRNPVSLFYRILSRAEERLSEIRGRNASSTRVFIVTGSAGQGKTTFVRRLVEILKEDGVKPGGITSERIVDGSNTSGYDIVNVATGERKAFLRSEGHDGSERIGRFYIDNEGLEAGRTILGQAEGDIIVIDEVGRLEIAGGGWAPSLDALLARSQKTILLAVRDSFAEEVIRKWSPGGVLIFKARETEVHEAASTILKQVALRQ